jgi:ketosteroid isomerase-like protein
MDRREITGSDRPAWQQEVRALEDEGHRAFIARDLERLEDLWSDDLIVNSPINRVHDKPRILDLLRAGTIAHSSIESQIEAIERQGNVVVVMGSETVTNAPDGPIIRRRFTNLWHAEGDSWRLIARHANIIADPMGSA